jgi:hypothetical protein
LKPANHLRVKPELDSARVTRDEAFEFFFEGEPIIAYPGETIGAALTAAGIVTFRTTRKQGKPRGLFCGIGICFDCLLVVDGAPNQRACLTPARPGTQIHVQTGTAEDFYSANS